MFSSSTLSYLQVLNGLKTEVYVYNSDKKFEYCNKVGDFFHKESFFLNKTEVEFCSYLGISYEIALERIKNIELVFQTKSPITVEECIHFPNGTIKYYIQNYTPITDLTSEVTYVMRQSIDVTEKVLLQKEFEYLANHDPLTGLPNRRLLYQTLEQRSKIKNQTIGIFLLDLDRFKLINDTLGHNCGDELIRAVAGRLLSCISAKENSVLARLGGDEFVIVRFGLENFNELEEFSKQIISLFIEPFNIKEHQLFITTSIGVYSFYTGNDLETIETMIHKADIAMYNAKENGRNLYSIYKEGMISKSQNLFLIESKIYTALQNGEFTIALQPKISVRTGNIVGAEVLLRWKEKEIYPISNIIFTADATLLINQIGYYTIQILFQFIFKHKKKLSDSLSFTINLTETQFYDPNLINFLQESAFKYEISLSRIELEIKENTIMKNTERSVERINSLQKIGVKVGIDDYGSGSSSLSYLRNCKIDFINIDKSFVKNITESTQDAAITSAIVTLAHQLQTTICAEGIENQDQALFLKYLKCDLLQGFYFSYPLFPENFLRLFQKNHNYLSLLNE